MAYGYAYSILGDFHLAQDAAQGAFLEAHRRLPDLRDAAAFPGWPRRVACKYCDRVTRRKQVDTVSLPKDVPVASGEPPPDAALPRAAPPWSSTSLSPARGPYRESPGETPRLLAGGVGLENPRARQQVTER